MVSLDVKTNRLSTWDTFLTDLFKRFGPSEYRDLWGELSKLVETSTILDYYNGFEDLSTKVTRADEAFLQSCFEFGICAKIRRNFRIHRPTTLLQAVSLAKMIEDKLHMLGKLHNSLSSRFMRGVRINKSSDTQYLRGSAQTCLLHGLLQIFH